MIKSFFVEHILDLEFYEMWYKLIMAIAMRNLYYNIPTIVHSIYKFIFHIHLY
jgi:hypothetical protein